MDDTKPSSSSTTTNKAKATTSDDLLNGILDFTPNGGNNDAAHQQDEKTEEDEESKPRKNKKDKKGKKKKNGVIKEHSAQKTDTLFEDDNIKISYFAQPSSKKPATQLDITLITENISSSTIKSSIKLSLSKSSGFKPKDKEKSSYTLAKKLQSNSQNTTVIKMKCASYSGDDDNIKCKISYEDTKSGSLSMKLPTYCFVTNESIEEEVPDEDSLMDIVKDKEKCGCKASERIKLGEDRSIADALDTLIKVWRVHNVSTAKKEVTYFAKLMLNKCVAIYVKTNTKKNAIEISLYSTEQQFVDSMLEEYKSIILD